MSSGPRPDNPVDNSTHSSRTVAILGGGAAGMACALWLKHLGFRPVVIERGAALGGQLLKIDRVNRWVLGIPDHTGPALAALYERHVRAEGIDIRPNTRPVSTGLDGAGFVLDLRDDAGQTSGLRARALVIATGLQARTDAILATPGALPLHESGRLSFFPLDHLDPAEPTAGLRVAVIGGGDNAHCTVQDLAGHAASIHLLIRSRPRAQRGLREPVATLIQQGRVTEYQGASIREFRATADGLEILLAGDGGTTHHVEVDRVFARTGFAPNTAFLAELGPLAGLRTDAARYLRVDAWQRASLPRVYAIGDVANPEHPAVVTAIAAGAVAARAIAHDLGAES